MAETIPVIPPTIENATSTSASTGHRDAPSPPPELSSHHEIDPVLEVRPFRKSAGYTRWWKALGHTVLESPSSNTAAEIGDLFVYKARCTNKIYTWVYREDGWRRVVEGGRHPTLPDRYLSWRSTEEPSWVTGHTYSTYQGRSRRLRFERRVRTFMHGLPCAVC